MIINNNDDDYDGDDDNDIYSNKFQQKVQTLCRTRISRKATSSEKHQQ
jgi:hypothetical protein